MPSCEHFVYTAGKIGTREGYQIVAKSEGISDKITESLLEYMYPIGVRAEEFKESRSLIILNGNKIAYSIIKNIGIGYDGRRGTLYNHTFVISKEEFGKLNYDSRIFDDYFIEDYSIRGQLQPIKIDPIPKFPRLELLQKLDIDVLKEIFHSMFKRTKIALVKLDDVGLIQNLLAMLPPPLRLVSFSTLVIDPDKQYKYEFIQIPERVQNKLGRGFTIISPELAKTSKHDNAFNDSVEILLEVIRTKDTSQLEKILDDFDKIAVRVSQVKNIELKEIFNQQEFKHIEKKEKFEKLKQKIQNLYSSTTFNQASTRVVVSITKKLGKMIEHALKRQQKLKNMNEKDMEQLFSAAKILLDCMYYTRDYSGKKISPSTKKELILEIEFLENMMKKYGSTRTIVAQFDPFEYMRMMFEQGVRYWQSVLPLWLLSKK